LGMAAVVFFILAGVLCFCVGIYALYTNLYNRLNKLTFLFCMSLTVWLYGAVRSMTAMTLAEAFSWRRFAALGVASFYGFLLHYIISLTETDTAKKKGRAILVYIPSILMMHFLALDQTSVQALYHLKKSAFGWISYRQTNIWTVLFDLYIGIYLISGLLLLMRWRADTRDAGKEKQSELIVGSYSITVFASLAAEIAAYFPGTAYLHQIAPLISFLPMLNIIYAVTQHHFMKAEIPEDDFLNIDSYKTRIMQALSYAFFAGSLIFVIANRYLYPDWPIRKNFPAISLFWLFGILTLMIQKKVIKKKSRILLYAFLFAAVIPMITLWYSYSAAITVWAFPFIMVIAALLFRNTIILMMATYSSVLTQLYLWIFLPEKSVTVDVTDYFGRIIMLSIAVILVCYINHIYLIRLRQLNNRLKTQDLLFSLSTTVMNLDSQNFENDMQNILKQMSLYMKTDYMFMTSGAENETRIYYSWEADKTQRDHEKRIIRQLVYCSWWKDQIKETGVVKADDTEKLPGLTDQEKEILEHHGIKTLLAVPMLSKGEKVGNLVLTSVSVVPQWDEEDIKTLITAGNILGEAENSVQHEREIEKMVFYDQLTRFPNRQLFGKCITQVIEQTGRRKEIFAVVFLDLDAFKNINDTMGHQYGDQILIAVSERLAACLRRTDMICRFGGDEFLVLLNYIMTKSDIERAVGKILRQFEEPFTIDEQSFSLTASVGISIYNEDGKDADTLIKNADIAMYKAKSRGKSQYAFCTSEMKEETSQTAIIMNELGRALDNREFSIVYQPQVDARNKKVIAAEALIRWNSRVLGNVSPASFIPIAEQMGQIIPIGEWVFREVCLLSRQLEKAGIKGFRLAVNVSVKQLLSEGFSSRISQILQETAADSHNLELEITENVAIQDTEGISEIMRNLKAIGVSIAIDDFGMEYSSLSRIKFLPIDHLKLDMSFVRGILTNEKDRLIVDAIIKMAKGLKLNVIAEGVEEEQQYQFLKENGCDEIQGYYFYRPLSLEDFRKVLESRNE